MTDQVESPGAVEDLVDGRAGLARRRGLRAAHDAVELRADRRQRVGADMGVGIADCGMAGLDGAAVVLCLQGKLVGQRPIGELPLVGQ